VRAAPLLAALLLAAAPVRGEWFVLRWIEKPRQDGPASQAAPEDRTRFRMVHRYDHRVVNDRHWERTKEVLREGDLVAYHMDKKEARKDIFLKGKLNKVGYRLLKYGHMAILVRDEKDEKALRLFSSHSFIGPNVREAVDDLKEHSVDVYRLDNAQRLDMKRLREFVGLVRKKAEKWYGYDFSGMFGLWNSNLKPDRPKSIGHDYICSNLMVAALYYSGLELDAMHRGGLLDVVTPKQVATSEGRFIPPPDCVLEAEAGEAKTAEGKGE